MKYWLPLLLLLVGSSAFAKTERTSAIPEVLKFKVNAMGDVTFFHRAHAMSLGCKACHDPSLRTMVTGKESAHKLCKGCHIAKEAGPMRCPSCHKK